MSTVQHFQGEFLERLRLAQRITEVAGQTGDVQAKAWALLDQIESLLPLARFEEARELLSLVHPLLQRNIGQSEAIWALGLEARMLSDLGNYPDSLASAGRALGLMEVGSPRAVYTRDGFAGVAEACLSCAEAGLPGALEAAVGAVDQFVAFAGIFPIASPRALLR